MIWFLVKIYFGVHFGYVIAMSAKKAKEEGRLTKYWTFVLAPACVYAVYADAVFNYTFGLMFLVKPQPHLFSATVQYHYTRMEHGLGTKWQQRLARFWAGQLNVFDDHIKSGKAL
jgi:hypothetical protein